MRRLGAIALALIGCATTYSLDPHKRDEAAHATAESRCSSLATARTVFTVLGAATGASAGGMATLETAVTDSGDRIGLAAGSASAGVTTAVLAAATGVVSADFERNCAASSAP